MFKDTWIVVANKAKANFLKAESNKDLVLQFNMDHEESRKRGIEIDSDRPGRSYDSQGAGRHHLGSIEPQDEEMHVFAKQIAEKLTRLTEDGELKQLFLVAGPKMLGAIIEKLHVNTSKLLKDKIDKDVVDFNLETIRHYLPEVL